MLVIEPLLQFNVEPAVALPVNVTVGAAQVIVCVEPAVTVGVVKLLVTFAIASEELEHPLTVLVVTKEYDPTTVAVIFADVVLPKIPGPDQL